MSRHPLDNIRVAKPCSSSWDDMSGDDRVRFCRACKLNVYNLSGMSRRDATDLVQLVEGRLCVRYFRRKDGTVLTADCPLGLGWKGAAALAASFVLATTAPFWGAVMIVHWQDIQAAITSWVGLRPPQRDRGETIMGALLQVPQIERPPADSPRESDSGCTEGGPDDTPPSRGRREAR